MANTRRTDIQLIVSNSTFNLVLLPVILVMGTFFLGFSIFDVPKEFATLSIVFEATIVMVSPVIWLFLGKDFMREAWLVESTEVSGTPWLLLSLAFFLIASVSIAITIQELGINDIDLLPALPYVHTLGFIALFFGTRFFIWYQRYR